jgi:hypothetical protein
MLFCFDCAETGLLTGISLHLEQRIEFPTQVTRSPLGQGCLQEYLLKM